MKTLEFKLYLNKTQQAKIDAWLEVQRWVWNKGLALLKEFEQFTTYNKHDKAYAPCCPVPWEYHWKPITPETEWRGEAIISSLPKTDKMRTTYLPVPYCISGFGKIGRFRQSCPLPQVYREPAVLADLINSKTGQPRSWESAMCSLLAHERHQRLRDSGVAAKVTQTTIKNLCTSWKEYQKGKRKPPRFKMVGDFNTLDDQNPSDGTKVTGNSIKLPKLGEAKIKTAKARWPQGLEVKSYRVCKRPSGYYLLLVGDIPETLKTAKPDECVGIDPGVKAAASLSDGIQYRVPEYYRSAQKRLRLLQRKMARQAQGGKNWQRTKQRVARLHEKISRQRKHRNHELSTVIARKYGGVAIEDNNIVNMVRRPKKQLREDGKGYKHNRAKAKGGLNKALLDVAFGQFRDLLKTKVEARGNEFHKVASHFNSQTCSECGVISSKSRLSQAEFKCVACGHSENADINAAKNIAARAEWHKPFTCRMDP